MNTDEIKVLPPKHYKQVYGEDYDAQKWKLRFDGLSDSEKKTLAPILEAFPQIKSAYWIPEVNQPDGKKTPDLLIDGRRVEIKEIKKKNSPEDQTKKAVEQVGENGWAIFDVSGNILGRKEYLRQLSYRARHYGLRHFAIVENGVLNDLFFTDKKNQQHHRTLLDKKSNSGNDTADFYNSILSQKIQKVNHQTHKLAPESFNKPTKYWEQRSLQRTIEAEKLAKPYLARLRMEYRASSDRAIDQIRRIYETYFGEAGFDRQKLREITPSGDLSRYIKEVRSLGVALPDNYQYRVNREEFLHAQLWLEAQKLGAFEQNISNELYSKVINRSFERTFGDYGGNFARLNEQTMNEILDSKFHGKNFSTRIWGRTDRLAEELHAKLAFAIAKGEGWERTSREIRERFGVAQSSAERLIRTETNYFENRAELAAYQELGIQEFEFLAALDGRTSEICRHHHGKRYKVEKGKSGENIPPLHPNCRSTIVAVVPELESQKAEAIAISQEEKPEAVEVKFIPKPTKVIQEIPQISLNPDLAKHLSADGIRQTEQVLNNMPDAHRNIWAKFADELKFKHISGEGDNYSFNTVNVNTKEILKGDEIHKKFETLLHEYGHGLDNRATRGTARSLSESEILPNGKTLGETVSDEAIARLNKHQGRTIAHRRGSLKNEILSELNNGYTKADMSSIFDLYGGAIYNKSMIFGIGHARRYWDGPKTIYGVKISKERIQEHQRRFLGLEAFAEMFSATGLRDTKQIELYEKYLPESFKMFNELLERMTKL